MERGKCKLLFYSYSSAHLGFKTQPYANYSISCDFYDLHGLSNKIFFLYIVAK
jgi:hypothetical protein